MKRSVNFTGRKPMKASHVLSIANWLGMSDAEQRVVFGGAPLFVNLNGEETTPAGVSIGQPTRAPTFTQSSATARRGTRSTIRH